MFDGVGWAAGEIVIFMIIAVLIGILIGWILFRWIGQTTIGEKFESDLAAERERTQRVEARLNDSSRDLDEARLKVKGGEGRLGELESELDAHKGAAAELEAKVAELGEKDDEIKRLSADLGDKAAIEAKFGALEEKDAEIARLSSELTASASDREQLAVDVAKLEGQVSGRDARIVAMEADLDAATKVEPVPQLEPAPQPEPVREAVEPVAAVAEAAAAPSKEEGLARIAEIASRTAGDGPAVDDDLKKVHGIGPKLEKTLKGLGITSFRQIANFQASDISYVTAALDAFKGRIERDDWMSSAAEEHGKKYDEPV
jgi:predicted flap endonuclease-1-like 5' DNA nuclease